MLTALGAPGESANATYRFGKTARRITIAEAVSDRYGSVRER